jgi:dTMP kinase
MKSKFYTVEGLDGSGKSTIAKHMGDYLSVWGVPNLVVEAYPRDEDAMFKRDLWIQQKVNPIAVLTLILELRMRVMKEQIIPALLEGKVVISDRWHDTTWAYQHHGMGIKRRVMDAIYYAMFNLHEEIETLGLPLEKRNWLYNQIHHYNTVHLDVSASVSQQRVSARTAAKDAFEKSGMEFFEKLQQGYSRHYRDRHYMTNPLHIVDANNDLDTVKKTVNSVLFKLTV